MQKGLEINFYDMLREIRKKWAILLAFALVFAVAANFYGYRRASLSAERERRALEEYAQSMGTTVDALPEHMTVELAELRSALTEEEASFVEAAAKLYMYRMWASDKINAELVVGEPDGGDLEIVQTLYYANEGVQSATQAMTSAEKSYYNVLVKGLSGTDMSSTEKDISSPGFLQPKWLVIGCALGALLGICCIALGYMLSEAQSMLKAGQNVLMVEQRAHCESEGSTITFGIKERYDCLDWIHYALDRFGRGTKILLVGISMGASTVLMAAGLPLPPEIKGIIADCPYTSPEAIIRKVVGGKRRPTELSYRVTALAARLFGGFDLTAASPIEAVTKTKLPILLIHGEEDRFVPCTMSKELYAAAPDHIRLELFPGAGHGLSYLVDQERYERVVREFQQQVLGE